jgi:ATP-dependent DNA helicase RecG
MTGSRLTLDTDVQYLRGTGPYLAGVLKTLGITCVGDLLFHFPNRYEDRRFFTRLDQLQDGKEALILARIVDSEVRFGGRRTLRVVAQDSHGSLLLRFFHFHEGSRKQFSTGRWIRAFGSIRQTNNGFEMVHPEYKLADHASELPPDEGLTPIYPLASGISQTKIRGMVEAAIEVAVRDEFLTEDLPNLPTPNTLDALQVLHGPKSEHDAELILARKHPAQTRLLSEELLAHQLAMRSLRQSVKEQPAPRIGLLREAQKALSAHLPFALTSAQQRVLTDIGLDLAQDKPMLRLVQGDVGSGKTVVAAVALLGAVQAGFQGALMAPTELLAEQHYQTLSKWFAPLGIEVCLLASKLKKSEKEDTLGKIAHGVVPVVVGTHALFQQSVVFQKLGLVVVDEQHRFGVQQRLSLRDKGAKGSAPHQLIMSATPIPRTLAQTLYADLDVSIIDELPPGRTPIQTVVLNNQRRPDVLARIAEVCGQGRQVYWVCTLIEESEDVEAEAAEVTAAKLREELAPLEVGLVHGRMRASEKEAEMARFKRGEVNVLVATTVIEVGVDVPNASVMVIENAERLGLAQLHQLRGRVGRGTVASQCVLMYQAPLSINGKSRLEVMRSSTDGFVIAEKDLELRGPGEILGRRQTGVVGLKIADPLKDADLIDNLQSVADQYLAEYPEETELLTSRWIGDIERYAQV